MTTRDLLLLLLLQPSPASAMQHFILSSLGVAPPTSLNRTLVPLTLSSATLTDSPKPSLDVSPVTLDSYIVANEWILNNWSLPSAEESVMVDVQLTEWMDVNVSKLLIQAADKEVLEKELELSLVFGNGALRGLNGLVQIHVDGMKTAFESGWLPGDTHLNQLIFDATAVEELALQTSVTIEQVVIRSSKLSFPRMVLGLNTAVTTLTLMHNTIAGPIELTENEYNKLSNIAVFRATGNRVDMSRGEPMSCVREEMISGLAICIVKEVQSSATYADVLGGNDNNGVARARRILGSLSATIATSRDSSPAPVIVLISTCTVVLVVVLVVVMSFFRRVKSKARKLVDKRHSLTGRDDGSFLGPGGDTPSGVMDAGDAQIIADMDLGKGQVNLHKKLGTQGLWLGECKDTQVVALKFVPRELDMSIKEVNAVRMSYVPLRHDNIVHFLGSSWTDCEEVLIVVEHMAKGSLRSVLADTKIDLAWPQRLQMSKDICSGLNAVRSIEGINLSRNLTARSVLVDALLVCKVDIFDYALSLRTDWGPARSFGHGDIASRAPELLKGDKITAAAEVYALGVIFCEISSRSKLFEHELEERGPTLADIFIATEVVAQRLKPSPAEDAPAAFRALIVQCLCYEPSERPKLREVLDMFST
uniref:Protein kinase domain-containing protein n=1 Tax=Peronospora matthiolae TaxID=2874970 RepID=A0AAV1V2C8_9STRA